MVNSKKVRENAYASLVRPTLEYSRVLRLGSHTKSQVHKLEMVQHRAARYTCNRYHKTSSVTDMLQTLNWPTVFFRLLTSRHMGDLKTPL